MEITLKNVGYRYKNRKILDHINLKIEDNRITGITGQYKTLLCEIIDAVVPNYTGMVTVGEANLKKENLRWIRKEVSFIRQESERQFLTDKVKEEMVFLISCLGYQPQNIDKKIEQSLTMVGLDLSFLDKEIKKLSSGEKKLLQIAISLIHNPSIIIFDEPFTELDYINQKRILKLIKQLKEKYHKTIIISSNDTNLLYEVTDDIVILKKGKIIAADETKKVYQNISLLMENEIEIPDLVQFTLLAKKKKVKLSFHRDIRDLIKDVYKHV